MLGKTRQSYFLVIRYAKEIPCLFISMTHLLCNYVKMNTLGHDETLFKTLFFIKIYCMYRSDDNQINSFIDFIESFDESLCSATFYDVFIQQMVETICTLRTYEMVIFKIR